MLENLQEKIAAIEKIVLHLQATIRLGEEEILHFQKQPFFSEDLKWAQLQRHHDLTRLRAELRQALEDKTRAQFELDSQRKQLGGLDVELMKLKKEMAEVQKRLSPKKEPPPAIVAPRPLSQAVAPPAPSRFSPLVFTSLALAVLAGAALYLTEPLPSDSGYIPAPPKARTPPAPFKAVVEKPVASKKQAAPVKKPEIKKIDAETPAVDSKLEIDLTKVPPPSPEEPEFDWMDRYLQPGTQ